MTQLDFMLGQVVKPENWPLFLSYYLRALLPDILTELLNTDHMHFITPHAGNFVHEVISIIQEDQDG